MRLSLAALSVLTFVVVVVVVTFEILSHIKCHYLKDFFISFIL